MKHPERVEDYLGHIAEAIARATAYLHTVSNVEAFEKNTQVQDAVVRNIEVIGEAQTASRTSVGTNARHAQHRDS